MKKSKSIAFNISVVFIALNVLSFLLLSFMINGQYTKIAVNNVTENSKIAISTFNKNMDDIRFYMNDLTLKMYADPMINSKCNELMKEPKNQVTKNKLVTQIKETYYDYLVSYSFIQGIGIFLEDQSKTDMLLTKTYIPNIHHTVLEYRQNIQEIVLENRGKMECFGSANGMIFARTLKDYSTVFLEEKINGTVMVVIRNKYIQDLLSNVDQTKNGYSVLVDENGIILYSTKDYLVGEKIEVYINEINAKGIERKNLILVEQDIESLDKRLIVFTPLADAKLSVSSFTKTLIWSVVIMVSVNFLLVWMISRKLTKPMENLVTQIQTIGITEIGKKVEAKGYQEIENIGDNFNKMLERIQNLVNENYVISINEKNARIEALQSQINPHFIFNTLDTINWKTMFMDMPEVTKMITCLGDMLRYTTYQYGKYVTIEQEITQIQNYIYIQKIRYDNSFSEEILVENQVMQETLPCLILQPLVENAIVHGLKNREQFGKLYIDICKKKEMLNIKVCDNGEGMDCETIHWVYKRREIGDEESIGLRNVNKRLRLIYGLDQGLNITSELGKYTIIEINIPLKRSETYDKGNNC